MAEIAGKALNVYRKEGIITLLQKASSKMGAKSKWLKPNFIRWYIQKNNIDIDDKFLKREYRYRGLDEYDIDIATKINSDANNIPPANSTDVSSIFPCSNDVVSIDVEHNRPQVYVGVGNLATIDVLSHLNPRDVYIMEINPNQLAYIDTIFKLIENSSNRVEFISRFYGKNREEIQQIMSEVNFDRGVQHLTTIEDRFWRCEDVKDPINEIHEELLNYSYKKIEGKRVGIQPMLLGSDMRNGLEITASFLLGGEYDPDVSENINLYPLYRDWGFLSSNSRFSQIKEIISTTDPKLIPHRMSGDFLHWIADEYPYHEIHLWLSNILYPGLFDKQNRLLTDKIKFLGDIANYHYSDQFYNLQIWEDERTPFFDSNMALRDSQLAHWDAFSAVNKHRVGKTLEIRVDPERAKKNSYLPNTTNIHYSELSEVNGPIDTIFYHVLVGHGLDMEDFVEYVERGFGLADTIIILEHNANSTDFSDSQKGTTPTKLRDLFGEPTKEEYTAGISSDDRNIVFVY